MRSFVGLPGVGETRAVADGGREGEVEAPELVCAARKGLADVTAGIEEVGGGTTISESDRKGLPVAAAASVVVGAGWKSSA
ncbi:MAG: hypothetical protein OEY80_02500 [Nitrospirota bacterium]|nr:hypothetical protein [Nitrospirota bacterium]